MKTQLIKIQEDKFILVSDERMDSGKYFDFTHRIILDEKFAIESDFNIKKIIAGIPNLPSIDFSDLKEEECIEIGYVDVEKLANIQWGNVHRTGVLGFIEGFKKAQELNTKLFSEGDMEDSFNAGVIFGKEAGMSREEAFDEIIQSLQQPKVWDVEVEMEEYLFKIQDVRNNLPLKPKITNEKVKITKIL